MMANSLIYEKDVIDAVRDYLEERGFDITQQLSVNERGDDLVAELKSDRSKKIVIEAKGGSSSRTTSNRFGKPFTMAQVRDHVAMALFKACEVLTRRGAADSIQAGIALPDNPNHRRIVERIGNAIRELGILVFWVSGSREVRIWPEDWDWM